MKRAIVALVAITTIGLTGCGGGSSSSDPAARCEKAWNQGAGNAGAQGVDRTSWMADCVAELGG